MISIIVPVYNAEKTLDRCVKSIIKQSYKDVEIILVDDGSTDKSPELCDNFTKCDDRIKTIHKTNGGVSSARNEGLLNAQGDYISFIDSDDYVDENYISSFFMKGELAEFSIQGYKAKTNNGVLFKTVSDSVISIPQLIHLAEANNTINSPWGKMFSNDIIKTHLLKFDERLSYGEDHLFVLNYLLFTNTIHSSCNMGYNYVDNQEGSLTHKLVPASTYAIYLRSLNDVYKRLMLKYSPYEKLLRVSYNRRLYYNLLNYLIACSMSNCGALELSRLKEKASKVIRTKTAGLSLKEILYWMMIRNLPSSFLIRFVNLVK